MAEDAAGRVGFGEVFAVGEFRALWVAQLLSVAGDQLARVALTLLVFGRTHSALLAAVTYAASIVPSFAGGLLLARLADRLPRRAVMIGCDLARGVLVAVMVFPGLPVAVLVVLLVAATLLSALFGAARAGLYPEILRGEAYVLGTAVTFTTSQLAQGLGFAAGGVAVAFAGPRASLAADAATFALSGALTARWVRGRPAADTGPRGRGAGGWGDGLRLVFADPALRVPMLLGWLIAFVDVYEGVAAPLAREMGGGAVAVGLVLAAGALSSAAGVMVFTRLASPAQRARWMTPLAVAACASLVVFAARPPLAGALAILWVTGLLCCYQVPASAAFVTAAPPQRRSQAFGIAQGGISLGQGAAMIAAGAAAGRFPPSLVIAATGVLGVLAGTALWAGSHRTAGRPGPSHGSALR